MRTTYEQVLVKTNLPGVRLFSRGKVRDVYEVGSDRLLVVATDRISAFDVVLGEGIPGKGRVLTQMSRFWFERFGEEIATHFITTDISEYPAELQGFSSQLDGRSMLVRKAGAFPIECVVRGYLAGSGWQEYKNSRSVCGVRLPEGLTESAKLETPIFTPATKSTTGHDENISFEEMARQIGQPTAERLRDLSLKVYDRAREYAESRGILIADTKFEWGLDGANVILIDEVLTPDSSRFWPKQGYQPGRAQPSFDKQFVRDFLESLHWDKRPPAPPLPPEVVQKTSEKYAEAFRLLTGGSLR